MPAKRKTNRREFLQGKSAVDELADLPGRIGAGDLPDPARSGTASRRNYLVQVERQAMACRFQVLLNAGQHPGAVETAVEALDLVEALEAQLSVYRATSELSRINRLAGQDTCQVEIRLFQLLQHCLTLNATTGGAFDITASPLFKLWGFRDRKGRVPRDEEIDRVRQQIGSQHIELDPQRQTIRFRQPSLELNLGSIGKGYALDRCAKLLNGAGITDYMLHGGQSSILARGTRAGRDEDGGWSVALPHPLRPEKRLAEIRLGDRAIGTSGSGRQFFYHRGRRYGHVLDPRTGRPAEDVLSATVLATTATDADALATAFFVMGIEATEQYCEQRPDLSVIFVGPGRRRDAVSITTLNIEDEMLRTTA